MSATSTWPSEHGSKAAKPGWVLEDNKGMNRGLEAMGAAPVKRYRVYQRRWGRR